MAGPALARLRPRLADEALVAVKMLRWLVSGMALNALMESAVPESTGTHGVRPPAPVPPER